MMNGRRRGMTLLELILATTLLTTLVAAVGLVLRTGYGTWEAHQDDSVRITAANATVRHIARRARQAQAVAAMSDPAETSGTLSLSMPSGETFVWAHDAAAQEVAYGVGSASDLLAERITELSFLGYEVDGTTQTTVLDDVHSIKCVARIQLSRETGGDRTASCRAWLRSW
jgi:type II secretory pathway pseudopilin PulG